MIITIIAQSNHTIHMNDKKAYASINLPKSMIEELKIWKAAFTAAYGAPKTYEEIIRGMLDSLEDTEPAVQEEFCRIVERHPEVKAKMMNLDDKFLS